VPDKIFGLTLILDFIDRCHALSSLYPPPAVLASLPNSTTSAYILILARGGGIVNLRRGKNGIAFWRFGKILTNFSIAFVQFFLTFCQSLIKIDSVWCTLPQCWVSQRFMITGERAGVRVLRLMAFCFAFMIPPGKPEDFCA